MSGKIEMEIKLQVTKKNLQKMLNLAWIKPMVVADSVQDMKLITTYYDTSASALAKAGLAYRIRQAPQKLEATVKMAVEVGGGYAARAEYNQAIMEQEPVLQGFDAKIDEKLVELVGKEELEPLFSVEVERTIRQLQITPDTLVELAIDAGAVKANKKTDKIDEIEFEILEGNKEDLFGFVAKLAKAIPVFVEVRSKYARGLALLGKEQTPSKDGLNVSKNGNAEVEFKKIITAYINEILVAQNQVLLNKGEKADKLLLNKVKTLRAFINFVSPLLKEKEYLRYRELVFALNNPLQEYYVLQRFGKQWGSLEKATGILEVNTVMQERLAAREEELRVAIVEQIKKGEYSAFLWEILASLENSHWQESRYLTLEQFALHRYQDWSAQLAEMNLAWKENEEVARQMRRVIEVMVLVRNNIKVGRLTKDNFVILKVLYRALKALNFDVYGHKDVLGFLQGTNSRVLYRDVGLLLGYRLGEMPKLWFEVHKNWKKLISAIK